MSPRGPRTSMSEVVVVTTTLLEINLLDGLAPSKVGVYS